MTNVAKTCTNVLGNEQAKKPIISVVSFALTYSVDPYWLIICSYALFYRKNITFKWLPMFNVTTFPNMYTRNVTFEIRSHPCFLSIR